jgi:hypothetical protein
VDEAAMQIPIKRTIWLPLPLPLPGEQLGRSDQNGDSVRLGHCSQINYRSTFSRADAQVVAVEGPG